MNAHAHGMALTRLLEQLSARRYQFVPPTPATHRRFVARAKHREARNLRDVFGWSLPFRSGLLDAEIIDCLHAADALESRAGRFRAKVRVASLHDDLFLHSAFPPGRDSVFFGPDSYRFASFLQAALNGGRRPRSVLDLGTGSAVGGIVAARLCGPERLLLTDINPRAIALARANVAHAQIQAEFVLTADLHGLDGPFDLVIANPPFIAAGGHAYRDGGDMRGAGLSLRWATAAADKLSPKGRLLLYTGSAIVDGQDDLRRALMTLFSGSDFSLRYDEIDPDIFGEELSRAAYRGVERIAAVGAVIERRSQASDTRDAIEGAKTFLGMVVAGSAPIDLYGIRSIMRRGSSNTTR